MKKLFLTSVVALLLAATAQAADYPTYPDSATPVIVNSANAANATLTATMPVVSGRMNFLTAVHCSYLGATAAGGVLATITGLQGGTKTFVVPVPAGATVGAPIIDLFSGAPAIPASAAGVAIALSVPALGTGNTNAYCSLYGFHTRTPS